MGRTVGQFNLIPRFMYKKTIKNMYKVFFGKFLFVCFERGFVILFEKFWFGKIVIGKCFIEFKKKKFFIKFQMKQLHYRF